MLPLPIAKGQAEMKLSSDKHDAKLFACVSADRFMQ
jgi:hypothetical protein